MLIVLTSCKSLQSTSTLPTKIETGIASWYGPGFQGKKTANGETFNTNSLTAAHRTLPFGTYVQVVNEDNGQAVIVRINDRGPFAKNRIIDLSKAAARRLEMIEQGTARVSLYVSSETSQNLQVSNLKKASFTIQIGSLSDRKEAQRQASKYEDGWVKEAAVNGRVVYRVCRGKYTSEAAAKVRLSQLPGNSGFVKQIEN